MNNQKKTTVKTSEPFPAHLRRLVAFIILVFAITSCGKDDMIDTPPPMATTAHFPLEIGKYIDYNVREYTYRSNGAIVDTNIYELRDQIVGKITLSNKDAYVIDQFIRSNSSQEWQLGRSMTASIEDNEAIRQEDNFRFVKLQLPITKNATWNGNKYFDSSTEIIVGTEPMDYFKNWESKYLEINGTMEVNNLNFNNVHTVQLVDSENRLELRYGQEKYAEGVGLISRELRILDTQCYDNCAAIPWEDKAEKGIIYTQTVIDYN